METAELDVVKIVVIDEDLVEVIVVVMVIVEVLVVEVWDVIGTVAVINFLVVDVLAVDAVVIEVVVLMVVLYKEVLVIALWVAEVVVDVDDVSVFVDTGEDVVVDLIPSRKVDIRGVQRIKGASQNKGHPLYDEKHRKTQEMLKKTSLEPQSKA